MSALSDNTAANGLRGWWLTPPRPGMHRLIGPWEYRQPRHGPCAEPGRQVLHGGQQELFLGASAATSRIPAACSPRVAAVRSSASAICRRR